MPQSRQQTNSLRYTRISGAAGRTSPLSKRTVDNVTRPNAKNAKRNAGSIKDHDKQQDWVITLIVSGAGRWSPRYFFSFFPQAEPHDIEGGQPADGRHRLIATH